MSFTLIEYEQYTEASAYGDAETCHELCKLAEADRIFFGRSESAESERIFNPRKSTATNAASSVVDALSISSGNVKSTLDTSGESVYDSKCHITSEE